MNIKNYVIYIKALKKQLSNTKTFSNVYLFIFRIGEKSKAFTGFVIQLKIMIIIIIKS